MVLTFSKKKPGLERSRKENKLQMIKCRINNSVDVYKITT